MATDDSLSAASTPDRSSEARRHMHAGLEKVVSLRLRDGEEVFTVSPPAGVQLGNREARAVLEGEVHPPDCPASCGYALLCLEPSPCRELTSSLLVRTPQ
jgi:hypothetical protein